LNSIEIWGGLKKPIENQCVMAATYQQASKTDSIIVLLYPSNKWLGRRKSSKGLTAENCFESIPENKWPLLNRKWWTKCKTISTKWLVDTSIFWRTLTQRKYMVDKAGRPYTAVACTPIGSEYAPPPAI